MGGVRYVEFSISRGRRWRYEIAVAVDVEVDVPAFAVTLKFGVREISRHLVWYSVGSRSRTVQDTRKDWAS